MEAPTGIWFCATDISLRVCVCVCVFTKYLDLVLCD